MTQDRATGWTGRVVRLRMEGPAHGGEFVARHEGRVVFCRGGITGELVDVLIDDDPGRAFCRGTVQAVVEEALVDQFGSGYRRSLAVGVALVVAGIAAVVAGATPLL